MYQLYVDQFCSCLDYLNRHPTLYKGVEAKSKKM
jgi:hypothetical protein